MSAGTMYIAKYLECICGESVKCVQLYCERLDLIRIVHKRNLDFFNGLLLYFILQIWFISYFKLGYQRMFRLAS